MQSYHWCTFLVCALPSELYPSRMNLLGTSSMGPVCFLHTFGWGTVHIYFASSFFVYYLRYACACICMNERRYWELIRILCALHPWHVLHLQHVPPFIPGSSSCLSLFQVLFVSLFYFMPAITSFFVHSLFSPLFLPPKVSATL